MAVGTLFGEWGKDQHSIGFDGGVPILGNLHVLDFTGGAENNIGFAFQEQVQTLLFNWRMETADDGKLVEMTDAAAITLTVPLNASVAFPIGTQIVVERGGAGTVTVTPEGATVLLSAGGLLSLASQYSTLTLIKKLADTWLVMGDLA